MAEGEKPGNNDGWWGSWLNAAKEKTEKVFEMVSHDMAEFTATMQSDTKKVVDQAKDTLKTDETGSTTAQDRIKKGFTSLMEGLTKVLTVEPEDTSPPVSAQGKDSAAFVDRATARLRAVQVDTGTYLNEPSGAPEKYEEWLRGFDIESVKGDISEMLVTKVEVRSLYTNLVPSQVSHTEFWRRYFYKVHQLELDEARKQALMKRAETSQKKEDSISWDDDDWSGEENTETATDNSSSTISSSPPPTAGTGKTGEEATVESRLQPEPNTESQSSPADSESQVQSASGSRTAETQSVTAGGVDKDMPDSEDSSVLKSSSDTPVCDSASVERDRESVTTESTSAADPAGHSDKQTDPVPDCSSCVIVGDNSSDEVVSITPELTEIKTKVKGDLVLVGSERTSPSSESSGNKELSSVDDDWEQDFDVELTEEDIKAAEAMAKKLNVTAADYNKLTSEEDWESWD